jgi:hypothetical protein
MPSLVLELPARRSLIFPISHTHGRALFHSPQGYGITCISKTQMARAGFRLNRHRRERVMRSGGTETACEGEELPGPCA